MGISLYELGNYQKSKIFFNNALEFDESKISAEGWLSYLDDLGS